MVLILQTDPVGAFRHFGGSANGFNLLRAGKINFPCCYQLSIGVIQFQEIYAFCESCESHINIALHRVRGYDDRRESPLIVVHGDDSE